MFYTSYFDNIKNMPKNIDFFSIAGKDPEWYNSFYDSRYKRLTCFAPKKKWWIEWEKLFGDNPDSSESINCYTQKYNDTVLKNINISAYVNMIKNCSSFEDICFVCYEAPNHFCHRKIISKIFNDNGYECREF